MNLNVAYVPRYSEHTFMKKGEIPTSDDISARSRAIRQYGLECIGEVWVPDYGISPVYYGPLVDQDTRDLLCLGLYLNDLDGINEGRGPFFN